jgi:hypothetical protein
MSRRVRIVTAAVVTIVALVLALATIVHAKEAPAAGATTATTPESAALDERQRTALQQDAADLVSAWAQAGGADGFPFWETQYRAATTSDKALRRLVAATSANDLGQYTDAYLQLLRDGRSGVDDAKVVDELKAAHEHLRTAIDLRIKALESLRKLLARDGESDDADAGDPLVAADVVRSQRKCTADEDCGQFLDQLDRSYREARLATNSVQRALADAGEAPIPEGSFT